MASTQIGDAVQINQGLEDGAQSDVKLVAATDVQGVHLAGNPFGKTGSSEEGSGVGGGVAFTDYDTSTSVRVGQGSRIDANDLVVKADSYTFNVMIGISRGGADSFAVSGAGGVANIRTRTIAQLDESVVVKTRQDVAIDADDDLLNVNVAGGIAKAKSVGVGLSFGTNIIDRDSRATIGDSAVPIGNSRATPSSGVDTSTNTINLGYAHGLETGDSIRYGNAGPEDTTVEGLVDGDQYYVNVIDEQTVRIARSSEEAHKTGYIRASSIDSDASSINFDYDHGFETGDPVVYQNGNAADMAGLLDEQTYFAIRLDQTQLQLARSYTEAFDGKYITLDIESYPSDGVTHTLSLNLLEGENRGVKHFVAKVFDPLAAVVSSSESITLDQPHGFELGQQLKYITGGGIPIHGLTDGGIYYAVPDERNLNTFQVSATRDHANAQPPQVIDLSLIDPSGTQHGFAVALDPENSINSDDGTIELGYPHALSGGDIVVYSSGGGASVGGLISGNSYTVSIYDDNTIQLIELPDAVDLLPTDWTPGNRVISPNVGEALSINADVLLNTTENTLQFSGPHLLSNGDVVSYRFDGDGDSDTSGLLDGAGYYILVVDAFTVKLLHTPLTILAVDPSVATGVSHTFRIPFDPSLATSTESALQAETINLGYSHGFATGVEVIYSHGGDQSIGGLANKNSYYVIRVDNQQIRLADTYSDALEGISLNVDATVALGATHTIGIPFTAAQVIDSNTNVINFHAIHGLLNGQAVVYDNGGGDSIAGLNHGSLYYVLWLSIERIQLATDKADLAGSVVSLGASNSSTGRHRLLDPITDGGLIEAGGETTVTAETSGLNVTATLAAAYTSSPKSKLKRQNASRNLLKEENAQESKSDKKGSSSSKSKAPSTSGKKFGFAASGSVSVNLVSESTEASIQESTVSSAGDVRVKAENRVQNYAVSGAAAISNNKKKAVGVAGAVTFNDISTDTLAFTNNARLLGEGNVAIDAVANGSILAVAAGLAGAPKGFAAAGSVAINTIASESKAFVIGGSVEGTNLFIAASNSSAIVAVGGAIAFGGKAGFGAGIAVNSIDDKTQAYVDDAAITVGGLLSVTASNQSVITGVAAALAVVYATPNKSVPTEKSAFGFALAAGVSVNSIDT